MEKYLKYFVLMLATVLSLSLASCGGGDDDEPDQPGKPSGKYEVVSKTVNANSEFWIYYSPDGYVSPDGYDGKAFCRANTGYNNNESIIISFSDWKADVHSLRYAAYGEVKSLESIKSVNGLNWVEAESWSCLTVEEKSGCVIEGTREGQTYYVRLFIDSFNRNASGDVIGINLKYQQFNPAQ